MPLNVPSMPSARCQVLRSELLSTVDALDRRRACDVAGDRRRDDVKLGWLERHGGLLRLTAAGRNVCDQTRALLE